MVKTIDEKGKKGKGRVLKKRTVLFM